MRAVAVVIALLTLSCGVQCWSIRHAVVPAQDAVRYVVLAQAIERDGLIPTLKEHAEHPLFPALVWLTHAGLSHLSDSFDAAWALSAQLAAAAMLVLTLMPLYLFLRQVFGEGPATAGGAMFCLLPAVAHLGADGLSDSTQLLFIATALWSLSRYWHVGRPPQPAWLLLFGACIGVGLLARPEALVLLPTLAVAAVWFQCRAEWRQRWRPFGVASVCVVAGLAAVMGPYLKATAAHTPGAIVARVLGREQPPTAVEASAAAPPVVAVTTQSPGDSPGANGADISMSPAAPRKGWRLADGEVMAFGAKDRSVSTRFSGYRSALAEFLSELPEALHYWIGLLAVYGLWTSRREPARPIDRFGQLLFATHSLAAIHLAAGLGYLSERHLLTLVLLTLGPAGRGALDLGTWLLAKYHDKAATDTHAWLNWAVPLLAAAACLPQTLAPLHTSRQSHRRAGDWLAQAADVPGAVLDTRGWTALYSGRPTYRYDAAKTAYRDQSLAYVVVDERELQLDSSRGRTLRHLLGGAAEQVARFAADHASADTVLVFRWRPERFTKELKTGQREL